ncbi:uncharacterized protein L203_106151 [Cryptococcus depauperatus CBS 7841]|uniref:Uncharacterized protein n=1 Tax=Cryptococcus depauperatus CBS 7841 TaxID=1295531 RepID=A0A1E3IVJ8_9TREE|nr:hypothetical protein L203_00861 [Cryptococcus depauperatus CBS 7841]
MLISLYVFAVVAIIPSAFSSPSSAHHRPATVHSQASRSSGLRARPLKQPWGRQVPDIGVGGVKFDILELKQTAVKRSTGNGTLLPLGATQNTFIVPVSIGLPPVTYPLQLDLGSSDILLASTLCGLKCPESGGSSVNPYYDVSKQSASFQQVNSNQTYWNTSYMDHTMASGFLAKETITLGSCVLQDQVFGLINATNLTLSDEKMSGILGLGFPRLSTLSRALLSKPQGASETLGRNIAASSTGNTSYLPTLMENLVRQPHIPYPAFALALAPPVSTSPASSASASSLLRYQTDIGSLTLGGVSALYMNDTAGSGRTVGDIEWHNVVPFGQPLTTANAKGVSSNESGMTNATTTSVTTQSAESAYNGSNKTARKRSNESRIDTLPSTSEQLSQEEYLYWAVTLKNISVNGTVFSPNSSYASIGLPSVALLDVGFNGIAGPQQDVARMFSKIADARQLEEGRWAVPCNTKMTIGFSFGGRYIQLQPSDWMYSHITNSQFCLAWPIAQPSTGDGIDWQFGTPFLRNVYSIYSYGINGKQAPLVGFLPLHSSSVASSSASDSLTPSPVSSGKTDPTDPTPASIASLSLGSTLNTVLPNAILPSPAFPTPSYAYSAMPTPPTEGILQYQGLGNSSAYEIHDILVFSLDQNAVSSIAVGGGNAKSNGCMSKGPKIVGLVGWMGVAMTVVSGVIVAMFWTNL